MNNLINEKDILTKYIASIEESIYYLKLSNLKEKQHFLDILEQIVSISKLNLKQIENKIYETCVHHFVEDYIDVSLNLPLQRIHYCTICEINYKDYQEQTQNH